MRDRSAPQPRTGFTRINVPSVLGVRTIACRDPISDGGAATIRYKDILLDCGYRIDLLLRGELIVEIKSVEALLPIHQAQILTYMRLGNFPIELLINFNVTKLQTGIKRFVL